MSCILPTMIFDNTEIPIDDLPQVDAITWSNMDPKYIRRLLTQSTLTFLILCIGIVALQFVIRFANASGDINVSAGWLWLLVPLLAIPLFCWPFISVPRIGYAVRNKDIIYKSGVFWHTVTAVPFNRIQHVEKSSTPLDRRFDIASLQLFTAGGSGGDLKIHGLPVDTAEALRVLILDKVGASIEHR